MQHQHIVALVCTDQGIVQNKQFTLPNNISIQEVVKTCEIINKMLVGTPIDEVSERLEYEIKPIIAEKIEAYETVYSIFSKTFSDFASNLIEKIEATDSDRGVSIYIGKDSEFDPNVTVIKTTYRTNGSEGTIAIIGPKRMEYDRVVGLLSFINKELNKEDSDE